MLRFLPATVAVLFLCVSAIVEAAVQVVVVEVLAPGRSFEQVEVDVAIPLERVLSKLPLVQSLRSSIADSLCRIEVFYQGVPSPASIAEVEAAVEAARVGLPKAVVTTVSVGSSRIQ
jgi:multidrug efflux pump subunit AcrB